MNQTTPFDSFADTYNDDLNQALSLTGEGKGYYAKGRIERLVGCLRRRNESPASILDYGCGIGDTTPLLKNAFNADCAIGLDVSERSLQVARASQGGKECEFRSFSEHSPNGSI